MICEVPRLNFQEAFVDRDFVCTGARQNSAEKSGAWGTHKLLLTWPEARLDKILIKHVPFQIAPDFWSKTCPKITVLAIVRFFAPRSSSFTAFSHFTVRPGRGKVILASPRDDRRATIFDVRDRFCDHLLSKKCVDWMPFAQGSQKRDPAKTHFGYTFVWQKKPDLREIA